MKNQEIFLTNLHLRDLNPILIGRESCLPNHNYGPAVRNYTLLHYVESGKGYFYCGGECHAVSGGEVFCILPGEVIRYSADGQEPWSYRWIGFDGGLSEHFRALPPVFRVSESAARCFWFDDCQGSAPEYRVVAKLFRLYGELFGGGATEPSNYVQRVKDYVEAAYMLPLRVEEIAQRMHLNRRYLSRLFREKTGQTVQEYILSVRMAEARRYLLQGLSVAETAERCGYSDGFLFSKMFKRRMGISPANWKREELNKKIIEKDL
ncbi:MAG: AraC family transcriptional regulator [Ruminococcaceae bacterium]|nr:AraC family transcriptional regulator [Oscillospiraceae bacterium]